MNNIILISLLAMVLAQFLKYPIYYFKTGKASFDIVFSTGSMPSSHSAVVVAMALETGITAGYDSPIFGVAFVFMAITIHDAVKVRGESGKQAVKINEMNKQLNLLMNIFDVHNSNEYRQEKLKELIGHSTSEVVGGMLLGVVIFLVYNFTI